MKRLTLHIFFFILIFFGFQQSLSATPPPPTAGDDGSPLGGIEYLMAGAVVLGAGRKLNGKRKRIIHAPE